MQMSCVAESLEERKKMKRKVNSRKSATERVDKKKGVREKYNICLRLYVL